MKHKLESRLPREMSINLRYADDTTLMTESEEELKSFLMKVKEESERVGLKHNIKKTKIMASGPSHLFISVQFSHSVMSDSLRPHESQHARPSCPSTNCRSLLKPTSIESVMPSNHFILCRLLLLLPSIFPSIRVFSNESALRMRWPKYWSI